MKAKLSNDGKIIISPEDSVDEYALDKWSKENEVGCEKLVVETRIKKYEFGFKLAEEK